MCNMCGGDAPDNCCPLCNLIRMAYGGESLSIERNEQSDPLPDIPPDWIKKKDNKD